MNTEWLVGNPSRINVFAALWVGSVGLLVLGLQPILLGALLTSGRVNFDQLALAATVEILAIGIGSVLSAFLLGSGAVRLKAAIFLVLTAIFNHATAATDGPTTIIVTRGLAGLAEGGLVAFAVELIARSRHPGRIGGYFVSLQTLAQAAIAVLLALWIVPHWGAAGGFEVLALVSAVKSCLYSAVAGGLWCASKTGRPGGVWSLASGGADGVAGDLRLLHVPRLDLGVSGAAGRRRRHCSRGHRADGIRQPRGPDFGRGDFHSGRGPPAISSGACCGWPPCAGHRFGNLTASPAVIFWVLAMAIGFIWLFVVPFQIRLAVDADASRGAALVVPAAQLFGAALGPAGASAFIDAGSSAGVAYFGAVSAAASVVFVIANALVRRGH